MWLSFSTKEVLQQLRSKTQQYDSPRINLGALVHHHKGWIQLTAMGHIARAHTTYPQKKTNLNQKLLQATDLHHTVGI